jgi:hypothetical protein
MYSIALIAITVAAAVKGDLMEGMRWLSEPGTYDELQLPISERTWSVGAKVGCLCLFSTMGFFGSSCSAAITKQFGALTMSITSTARKATTLFLSFFFFNNICTFEHLSGIIIFLTALMAKSLRRRKGSFHAKRNKKLNRQSSLSSTALNTQMEPLVGANGRVESFENDSAQDGFANSRSTTAYHKSAHIV